MSKQENQEFEFTVLVEGTPAQLLAVQKALKRVIKETMAAKSIQSAFIGHAALGNTASNVMLLPITSATTH